MARYMISLDP